MAYKNVFFILQDIYYLKNGVFCLTKKELLNMLNEADKEIMELSLKISEEEFSDFEQAFEKLFLWCQKTLTEW